MKKIAVNFIGIFVMSCSLFAQTVNFASSNLPIVVINTNGLAIPDDPKITADMGIIYNGPGLRNNLTDPYNNYNGKVGIETRGHSSQMFPMKAYGFELHGNTGNSVNKSILGMPKESDWILYAPYTDKTLMRNFLAYTLSQEMGHWAAHCQFVEVVLNGDYIGVYVLMEKIKRNANRVSIAKLDNTMISADQVSGGYIFSLDKDPNAWYSGYSPPANSQSQIHYSYVYPKPEDIVPEQAAYIKSYVDSFERALATISPLDTLSGYRGFIDVNSFMDYFYVNEVSRNVDGYRLSSFFYKDRNSKIVAGPVWDYDLAFRNADYCSGSDINGWAFEFNYVCPNDGAGLVPFWWQVMMRDTSYTSVLRCRWKDLRQNVLNLSNIDHLIDSINDLVSEAQVRHFQRWPVLGTYVWPNPDPIPLTYSGEIGALKSWITQRLDWVDKNIPNNGSCSDFSDVIGDFALTTNPNPFYTQLLIQTNSKKVQQLTVEVYDMLGKRMINTQFTLQQGQNELYIPSAAWPAGVYILRATSASGDKVLKKMVKR